MKKTKNKDWTVFGIILASIIVVSLIPWWSLIVAGVIFAIYKMFKPKEES